MASFKNYPQAYVGNKAHSEAGVVIVGAGISGICMAIDLLKKDIHNFVVLEKSGGPGGTWRDNKYPGCCCDVFSHLYSFSFEQNPNWTRLYSGQEEILKYLIRTAQKYDLYQYIRFNSSVEDARWNEEQKKWETSVKVDGGKDAEYGDSYTLTSDFLVSAVGQLNLPQYPNIPGLDDFQGKMMHSARWDWGYNFDGKRIGIIGNGATAAQVVPEVAKTASHLTVFQRTPNWVVPRYNVNVPWPVQAIFKYIRPTLWRFRATLMDFREGYVFDSVASADSKSSDLVRKMTTHMLQSALPNRPDLREKLTPNYPPGCKRVIISDDYFPAIGRDNVSLNTSPIEQVTENGIRTADGEEEFDLIILATGFRTVEFMHPIQVTGRDNHDLSDIWKDGARALYGVGIEHLPNFAMLYGPNTNLGHSSIILMIEAQARYVSKLISAVMGARQQGQTLTLTPKSDRVDEFNKELQEQISHTSFADPNCNSWYKNEKGLVTNNWSSNVIDYQKLLSKVNWNDFELSGYNAQQLAKKKTARVGRVVEETVITYKAIAITLVSMAAISAFKGPDAIPNMVRKFRMKLR
ncbi:hypothetical protein FQN54_004216 [Arachnomyces sp. PD_36]|nr:hypothetical protein FQN54_004216 [Arachnomyces sp. PD_36]